MSILHAEIDNANIIFPKKKNEWLYGKVGALTVNTRTSLKGQINIDVEGEPELSLKLRGLNEIQVAMRVDMQLALVVSHWEDNTEVSGYDDEGAKVNPTAVTQAPLASQPTTVDTRKTNPDPAQKPTAPGGFKAPPPTDLGSAAANAAAALRKHNRRG